MTTKDARGAGGLERLGPGRYRSADAAATTRLGELLGGLLQPGDVVVLSGDLGAGKTCLTGGVARGLGDARPVTSPTFTIMCVHDGGRIPLYHFDLYRLESVEALEDIDYFGMLESGGVCLVEWGDKFPEALPDDYLELALEVLDDGRRRLELAGHGARGAELEHDFAETLPTCQR